MLDDFREWLSDNLRYFMLGGAIILILLLLFFGIRFVTSIFGKDAQEEVVVDKIEKQEEPEEEVKKEEEKLEEEKPEEEETVEEPRSVEDVIQIYYAALSNKDTETLKKVMDQLDPEEEKAILEEKYIEKYQNVITVVKPGLTEKSFVVFARYGHKYLGYDTILPGVSCLYVDTNQQGDAYIVANLTQEQQDCINQAIEEQDIQDMITKDQEQYDKAIQADEALGSFLKGLGVN